MNTPRPQFLAEYAHHRAAEGRGYNGSALRALPYLTEGPFSRQWQVRARSFDAFVKHVIRPVTRARARRLEILDLGAGNGWLCFRLARSGHKAVALDLRTDNVDGLGAADEFLHDAPDLFERVVATFDDIPLEAGRFDVAVFNASLHYAQDLERTLREAVRVTRQGGFVIILDSPFYTRDEDGAAMVAEKHRHGETHFGARANVLLSQGFIEYLTPERLAAAKPDLTWSKHRVLYPLWYEVRPLQAWLRGARRPSRFDLWSARVP